MPGRRVALTTVVVALAAGGCQFPRDVEGTLDRVEGGTLRVGVTEHEPFVVLGDGEPTGVEIRLLEDFARRLGATVEYVPGPEEALVEQLTEGELDVVAGGLTKRSPWRKEAAPTRPYATTHGQVADKRTTDRHVLLARNGENAFLVRLERYLLDRREQIERDLAREGED
jgi:polar amino acid transport system substrate-binding protein